MKLRYQILISISLFAMIAYMFYFFKIRSELFLHKQSEVTSRINKLKTIEADINREILQSGFYLYYNYDELNEKIDILSETFDKLREDKDLQTDNYKNFSKEIDRDHKRVIEKIKLIREYQSLNSGIKNSASYLSLLIEKIDTESSQTSKQSYSYYKASSSLLSTIFRAKNSMDSDMLYDAQELLNELSKLYVDNSKTDDTHHLFVSHAHYFITHFDDYIEKVNILLDTKSENFSLALLESYHIANHEEEEFLNFILYLLVTIFTLMTLLIIYFLYTSDKKNSELRALEEINLQKERMLFQKSRQAQMGEMLSMISHQWRQPLAAISMASNMIQSKFALESFDLDKKDDQEACSLFIAENLGDINNYVSNLSTTIDDFKNFYKPDKIKREVLISAPLEQAFSIIKASLEGDKITTTFQNKSHVKLFLHDSELMQVFLNFFKNAQDNFSEKQTDNPSIMITNEDIDNGVRVTISDNGGGIPLEIQDKIFDPYFSTKDEKNGTGLGLYMCKIIVEDHHNGKLFVKNNDLGVDFIIELYHS